LKVPSIMLASPSYTANIPDNEVTRNIQMALVSQSELKAFDINVITLKGDVRLIGVVDTQSQIDKIVKLAREAEGAHAINNKLSLSN
jgi:hyperosmotically inducible protein